MSRLKLASKVILALFAFVWLSGTAFALEKVRIAGQAELGFFPFWIAQEKGWDKEEGLDIELVLFDSGMAMLNTLPSGEWKIGVAGAGLMGGLRYDTYIIGIANNDSPANGVLVRPDSPILKNKGANKDFPNVYGKSEDMKGKTLLTTTVSSAHYTSALWLKSQGLLDKDIVIKNMDQSQVISAFENNIGDMVSLWAPHLFVGLDKGWKLVADGNDLDAGLGVWLMCEKAFGDSNPEVVAKTLRVFMRGVNMLHDEPMEKLAPVFKKFMIDYCGIDVKDELIPKIIKSSPVIPIDEQIAIFNADSGESTAQKWLAGYAQFLADSERISQAELDSIKGIKFATNKFLKLVKMPIPPNK